MKHGDGIALGLFVAVMGTAVALAIASDVTEPMCEAFELATAKTEKPYLGCLDFWFERYQTMLAAFIGAGVALFVVRPVFQQIGIMNRQSAAQLREIAEQRARELEAERDAIQPVAKIIGQATTLCNMYDDDNWPSVYSEWIKLYGDWQLECRAVAKILLSRQMRYPELEMANSQRAQLTDTLRELAHALASLSDAFISGTSGLDPSSGETDLTAEQMAEARQQVNPAIEKARAAYQNFAIAHDAAVKQSWEQANRFSATALT